MRIVLTGGGSGGHLTPLEPIIDALRLQFREYRGRLPVWIDRERLDIYFLGILDAEGEKFFTRLGVKAFNIPSGKLRRYPSTLTISDFLFRLPLGLLKALWRMWVIMPDAVVSKGGYGSLPASLAAAYYRVPFLLHESDALSGLTNRWLAPLATVITVGYVATRHGAERYKQKTVVTGIPVRAELFREEQTAAKKQFGFSPDELVLLVMGGSQGAEQLNRAVLESLPSLLTEVGILHLTGPRHLENVRAAAQERMAHISRPHPYRTFGYLSDTIGQAIIAADAVVTRAGATALAEMAYARKAIVIVPLASAAQDHQRQNAAVFEAAEAAVVVSPENLGRALLVQSVRTVLFNKPIRTTLIKNIGTLSHPRAAHDIAALTFKLAVGLAPIQPAVDAGPPSAS